MSTFDRRIVSLTWRQFFGWIVSSDEHVTRVSIAPIQDLLNLSLVSFSALDQLGVDDLIKLSVLLSELLQALLEFGDTPLGFSGVVFKSLLSSIGLPQLVISLSHDLK